MIVVIWGRCALRRTGIRLMLRILAGLMRMFVVVRVTVMVMMSAKVDMGSLVVVVGLHPRV